MQIRWYVSKLVTLRLAGNHLLSFPNDRIDVLASLLHLDVSRNHIDHLPTDLPYLYRLKQVYMRRFNDLKMFCDNSSLFIFDVFRMCIHLHAQ